MKKFLSFIFLKRKNKSVLILIKKKVCWPMVELARSHPHHRGGVFRRPILLVLREFIDLPRQVKQKPRDFLSCFSARIAALPGPHWQPHPAPLKVSLISFLFSSANHRIKTKPFLKSKQMLRVSSTYNDEIKYYVFFFNY